MKKLWSILTSVLLFTAVLALLPLPASAQNTEDERNPTIISRDAVAYGRTYSEWNAAWQQWAYSIPFANHPLFDKGDCSVGQTGPVWFLGGKFCPNGETCDFANVVRACTIPSGKAIYLPALNAEDSVLEESVAENPSNPDAQQINFLRNFADGVIAPAQPYVMVDGRPVRHLVENFTVESPAFVFTIPDDNYLKAVYGANLGFPAGSYFPAVDKGIYVMIAPLPPGRHVIQFGGTIPNFALNVKYFINVTR